MTTGQKTTKDYIEEAHKRGEAAARAAASWVTTDRAAAALALALIEEDADWEVLDQHLPRRPDLSGEFADDPTPRSLALDIGGPGIEELPEGGEITQALAEAYEKGVDEVFLGACKVRLEVIV